MGLQLAVAAGRPLPFGQADVVAAGHAVEVRLCAERPREDYRPTPGTATHVRWPDGPGLRVDGAIGSGSTVSAAYDSLVAKVMAHERGSRTGDRELSRAPCGRSSWTGSRPIESCSAPCSTTPRSGGASSTSTTSRTALTCATPCSRGEARRRHGAAVAFCLLDGRAARSLVPVPAVGWRNVGRPLHVDQLTDAAGTMEVQATAPDEPACVLVDGTWQVVGTAATLGGAVDLLTEDGLRRRYRVRLSPHQAAVSGPEGQSTFTLRTEDDAEERGGIAGECRGPLPGAVTKVLVAVGDAVAEGDGLVVLEAMKMEHTLRANGDGTVAVVACAPGQQVDVNDLLVTVEPP